MLHCYIYVFQYNTEKDNSTTTQYHVFNTRMYVYYKNINHSISYKNCIFTN